LLLLMLLLLLLLLLLLVLLLLNHMWFIHGHCFGEQLASPSMTPTTCGSFGSNCL
jgi:hypothetical protein